MEMAANNFVSLCLCGFHVSVSDEPQRREDTKEIEVNESYF